MKNPVCTMTFVFTLTILILVLAIFAVAQTITDSSKNALTLSLQVVEVVDVPASNKERMNLHYAPAKVRCWVQGEKKYTPMQVAKQGEIFFTVSEAAVKDETSRIFCQGIITDTARCLPTRPLLQPLVKEEFAKIYQTCFYKDVTQKYIAVQP